MSQIFDKKKIKKAALLELKRWTKDNDAEIISTRRSSKNKGLYILVSFVVGAITFFAIVFVALQSSNNGIRQILTFPRPNTDSYDTSGCSNDGRIQFSTPLGNIIGNVLPIPQTSKSLFEFVGIPYCIPPVGLRRFWPCIHPKSFHLSQVFPPDAPFDATRFGAACYQAPNDGKYNLTLSEDCLSLNIWTPVDTNKDKELYPVMVFIYGGSMISGSGDSNNLTQFLMDNSMQQNIIGVTLNYRLGIFGFLQSEMLFEEGMSGIYNGQIHPSYGGMNGINDQIQAINWIKEHISHFGGDPDRITLFGESAGGMSVCTHLISPLTPRFHQAITESGPCIGPWQFYDFETGLKFSQDVMTNGTCYGDKLYDLDFLRSLSAEDLYQNVQMKRTTKSPWSRYDEPWYPSVDKYALMDTLDNSFQKVADDEQCRLNADRTITGFNSADNVVSGAHIEHAKMLKEHMRYFLKEKMDADKFLNKYYDELSKDVDDYHHKIWLQINLDVCMKCPILKWNQMFKNDARLQQHAYYFQGPKLPSNTPKMKQSKAWHGAEMVFLKIYYPNAEDTGPNVEWSDLLSKQMINAWQNYSYLEKNKPFLFMNPETDDLFEWLPYDGETEGSVLIFDDEMRMEKEFEKKYAKVCGFLDKLSPEKAFEMCANTHYVDE